jgi:hypothetical protein
MAPLQFSRKSIPGFCAEYILEKTPVKLVERYLRTVGLFFFTEGDIFAGVTINNRSVPIS